MLHATTRNNSIYTQHIILRSTKRHWEMNNNDRTLRLVKQMNIKKKVPNKSKMLKLTDNACVCRREPTTRNFKHRYN